MFLIYFLAVKEWFHQTSASIRWYNVICFQLNVAVACVLAFFLRNLFVCGKGLASYTGPGEESGYEASKGCESYLTSILIMASKLLILINSLYVCKYLHVSQIFC